MDDNIVTKKLTDLQQYLPFLSQVINNLKSNNNDKPRPQQLQKMEMLFSLISNKDKKPLKIENLIKCETVVQKIYNKIEKQKDESSNSSSATVDFTSSRTDNQEIIEITEPDSPPNVNDKFHVSPIVIPTERKESPPPTTGTNNQYKNRNVNKWQTSNATFRRDDELMDNNSRRRIPTIDRARNHSNDRFNLDRNFSTDYYQGNEIYDDRGSGFKEELRNFESLSYDKNVRNFNYSEKNDDVRIRQNLINCESNENEVYIQKDNFQSNNNIHQNLTFSEHLRNVQRDNYNRDKINNNFDDPQHSDWLHNREKHIRENLYDSYRNDSNFRESPPRSQSRNYNRRDDFVNRIDRQENNTLLNYDTPSRLNPGPSTSFDVRSNSRNSNLIEVPITRQHNVQINLNQSKPNEHLIDFKPSNSKQQFDNKYKIIEDTSNSIFNRLGNKMENFQIKIKNERALSKGPLIKDVLKSPPLTAHDIDELYQESGGEVDNSFDAVRKKFAKLAKIKDESLNRDPYNNKSSIIKSPDPNRLAYKYNPHPRTSLDDPLSPKSAETSKSTDNIMLKSPCDPRIQKQIHTTNSLPSVNPNDPRLKTWSSEINNQVIVTSNPLQSSKVPSIPSLLSINIPHIPDFLNQNIDKLIDGGPSNVDPQVANCPTPLDSVNYKKFHPHLNDQVERIKYLESKKNKPNAETTNQKATNNGENHQKTDDNKKISSGSSKKIENNRRKSKDNNRDKNIKNVDKSKDNSKCRSDSIGNNNVNININDVNKTPANFLDSMYRSLDYKKDLGSVASFKIPKKGKENDKEKTKDDNFKTNATQNLTAKELKDPKNITKEDDEKKTKSIIHKGELNLTELNETALSKTNDIEVKELEDIENNPIIKLPNEKIKFNLHNHTNETFPSVIEGSDWVVLSEIGTDNPVEESLENEENTSDKESHDNTDIKQQYNNEKSEEKKIDEPTEEKSDTNSLRKSIRNRRKSIFEIVDSTSDNSILSTQNIISGKRSSRSSLNLNENLLALTKGRYSFQGDQVTKTISNKKTNSSKPGPKKKQPIKSNTNSPAQLVLPESNLTLNLEPCSSKNTTIESADTNDATSQNSNKMEQKLKDLLESFFRDMRYAKNKSDVLGMLSKVLDDNKFQQVKKIIEDDDTDKKNELSEKPNDEVKKNTIESEMNVKIKESVSTISQASPVEKRKKFKKLTELDRLNADIRDMFISEGVITATGRRMCTMMNAANEKCDFSYERPVSRQQNATVQSKVQTKLKKPTKKNNNLNSLSKVSNESNLNKIPKVILSKVDINEIEPTSSNRKNRLNSKRRSKRFAWSKGIISKKNKKLAGTKKSSDCPNLDKEKGENDELKIKCDSNYLMPTLTLITADKSVKPPIYVEKPCPKSKKKFNYSNENDSILIGDEPILDNSLFIEQNSLFVDSAMPILTASSNNTENVPKSSDLLNISKLKNIYSGMHAKSDFSNKCILCKYTGSKVANHYTNNHSKFEVFISRLPPDTLKDLLANKNNRALYSFRKQKIHVFHYRCPFCDIQQSFSQKSWIDHFSTHTGEYAYKCSDCNRAMNMKQAIQSHFQNSCPNGNIIVREQLCKDNKVVKAFVCKLCNYVQMIEKNVITHLKNEHNILTDHDSKFDHIILINTQNIPILDGNEEQQQAALQDSLPKSNMDFIDPNQTCYTDKLDAFVSKEQDDLDLDKNLLNYMSDVSFSTADSSSQLIGKSSIIDHLSERLQSTSEDYKNSITSSNIKPITTNNRRYSIADQLSKRFKSVDQQNTITKDECNKITQHTIDETNNESGESPIPVVYILDDLDDDIDNVELAETRQQVIMPVDKPLQVDRVYKLNEMLNESNRNQIISTPDKNSISSSSIIARLNERFKSPQKKSLSNKEILQQKVSINCSSTSIIDRLNKRLNSVDDREKPSNDTSLQTSNKTVESLSLIERKTQTEDDELIDLSDDRLVIDESGTEENSLNREIILNESTGVFEPVTEYTKETEPCVVEKVKDSECDSINYQEDFTADDDDWEDIEIISHFDNNTKSSDAKRNTSPTDKNKNGSFYQTLSRLLPTSTKSKNKSILKNKKSFLKNKLTEEKKLLKKCKISSESPIPNLLPVTDAIPSPISNELTVDPPVPLPSEPLSDLNDISEILEEPTNSESIITNNNVTSTENICNTVDLCTVDNDNIFIINDTIDVEDVVALAMEIEENNDKTNQDNNLMATKVPSNLNMSKFNTPASQTIIPVDSSNTIDIDSSEKYRIDNIGFSITNGKIKYLCSIRNCTFSYSDSEFGLQNHYAIDHPNLTWEGYCYCCESIVCFDSENLPLIREFKHMNEVHINNIKKIKMNLVSDIQNMQKDPKLPEKPKISLRRLSGDILSVKPISINLNEDSLLLSSCNISLSNKSANCLDQISVQSANTNSPKLTNLNNSTLSSFQPLNNSTPQNYNNQENRNMSIKQLLNTPSLPPPIPINLNENRPQSPKIIDQLLTNTTGSLLNPNLSQSTTNSVADTTNKNLLKCYRPAKISRYTPVHQIIKNNSFGGSNLVISSVAEGVLIPPNLPNNQIIQPSNESMSLLKIQSVCSLNATENHVSNPVTNVQQQNNITESTTSAVILPTIGQIQNPIPIMKINPASSNVGSVIASKHINENCLQPWFQSLTIKPESIAQLQLRSISLYAFYKCMSINCFFTTNCPDKLIKHFVCHEFSGAKTDKTAALQSNINYRDWLTCSYCKYHGDNSDELLKHLHEIHVNDIYQCPYCFYRTCCDCNVQQHQKIYHCSKKPLIYVGYGDRKIFDLEVRFLIKNRAKYIKSIPCNDCPKFFYIIRNYSEHIQKNHYMNSENYTCGICKLYIQKKDVLQHLNSAHNISIYQCIHCPTSSTVRPSMVNHMTDEHSSNLMYSSIRVPPKRDVIIGDETIENSTVLANLTTNVEPSSLIECKFTIDQLNFMSPSLDTKSIYENKVFVNKIPSQINKPIQITSVESLSSNINDNYSINLNNTINIQIPTTNESSNTTVKRQSLLKPFTKSNTELITNLLVETSNNNLYDRITKAAKELVQDTGYEGYELYRCANPKCINIKITEQTLFDHIQEYHIRFRTLKCPHCTSQYQTVKTLKQHLNTHRMHKYFCYFCNYTTITIQSIKKHINDSHSNNVNISTVSLTLPSKLNNINNDDTFYVTCPSNLTHNEILQYGERLIRICERKKSLTKKSFKPDEIDQLPIQSIFHHEVVCSQCNYKTKVRTNMYRHLLYHTKALSVAIIDPVNPVPCLNTNQKHNDKMINLACSSNVNKDINQNNGSNNEITKIPENSIKKLNDNTNNNKSEVNAPIYIPIMNRFVCGVTTCNYLTINDSMLRHHLNALHLTEKSYKCPHCTETFKKQLCPDKIIQHLKFHDSKVFVCSECSYIHYQKYLVERHIYEKHSSKSVELITYERTGTNTIIERQTYCGGSANAETNITPNNNNINTPASTVNVDDVWECTICKLRTATSFDMNIHVSSAHNIRFRYACLHCKFGAGQFKTVMDHITDKHPTKDRKLKCSYNRIDETPVVTDDFLQQDNRPLWSRADPYRIKHIRGILMEDEDEQSNPILNNTQGIPKIKDQELLKPKINTKTPKLRTKSDLIQKSESQKKVQCAVVKEITAAESNNIDIYQCGYCPIKNITFKTIHTHWYLHHFEKPTQNNNPSLLKQFSFKLYGFMSQEGSEEIEVKQITNRNLKRLQRLGQKTTRFQCSECWRLFPNCASVTRHQETEHINASNPRCLQYKYITFYVCHFCGYASSMECKTAAHLLNHYNGFKKCHLCNLKFDKLLDFVCHLHVHKVTINDFIKNDKEIEVFWNELKILYPNGLSVERGLLQNLENNTLENLVIEEIKEALKLQGKSQSLLEPNENLTLQEIEKNSNKGTKENSILEKLLLKQSESEPIAISVNNVEQGSEKDVITTESDKESIINLEKNSVAEKEKHLSTESETESETTKLESKNINSNNTVKETNKKPKIKKRKKHNKDNDWMPSSMKKRKTQNECISSESESDNDEDLIPLKFLTEDNQLNITLSNIDAMPIIVPKYKPGPKSMQRKPYSYYGLIPEKIDLGKLFTTMKLGNNNEKPIVISCENFARLFNIEPRVYIKKLNLNILNENESGVTYKRKFSHLNKTIIEDEPGYSTKKYKESL